MDHKNILLGICSREDTRLHIDSPYTHLISLADPEKGRHGIETPKSLRKHLILFFHDMDDIESRAPRYAGCIRPTRAHVLQIMETFRDLHLPENQGVLVHCEAGISRSTAAAILGLCALGMSQEAAFNQVQNMNELGLPNRRMLRLGGEILGDSKTLPKMATEYRRYIFTKYQQEDPIEWLRRDTDSKHPLLVSLQWLACWTKDKFRGCEAASLQKTLERWRTKISMTKIREQRTPQRERLLQA